MHPPADIGDSHSDEQHLEIALFNLTIISTISLMNRDAKPVNKPFINLK